MRKALTILIIALCVFCTSCATKRSIKDNSRYIVSIYAKEDAQPYGSSEKLDTIWVYYSDGTFEQFAELNDNIILFSTGEYKLKGCDDFYVDKNEGAVEIIVLRNQKFQNGKLSEYKSEHIYDPIELGFTQLYGYNPKDGKIAEVIFYALDKQLYIDTSGDKDMLDTCWIYYNDMTFEQYAALDESVVLFSTGTYKFADGGDFIYDSKDIDDGDIIIERHQKYKAGEGLVAYESSHRYDLNSLGFKEIALSRY